MSAYKNPYAVLGLTSSATLPEIKDAYRKLCMRFHPDLCPPAQREAAERFFKDITAAYTKLTRQASGAAASTSAGAGTSQQWARAASAAAAAGGGPTKYSNGVVGAVIAAPLVLLGMWLQHKSRRDGSLDATRPHGLLHPPVNPYLREDLRPRMQSRGLWTNGWSSSRAGRMSPPEKKNKNVGPRVPEAAAAAKAGS